jgi:succinoglycan biosynthesis transport protein ExoP
MTNFDSALDVVSRRRYLVLAILLASIVAAFMVARYVPRNFQAVSQVLIVNDNTGRDPSVSSADLPAVTGSSEVLTRVKNKLALPMSLTEMKRNLSARVPGRSSIMQIGYKDTLPDRAVNVANTIADELTGYYHEISTHRYDQNVQNLDAALAAQRQKISSINAQLQKVIATDPFVGSDKALDLVTARLDDLETQRGLAYATMAGDTAQASAVSTASRTLAKTAVHEILQGDPFYRAIQDGTAKDSAELAFEHSAFKSSYPGLPGLSAKVQAEQAQLSAAQQNAMNSPQASSPSMVSNQVERAKANATVSGDQARIAQIDNLVSQERARLHDIQKTQPRALSLRIERDVAQADYLSLSARRATALANRAEATSLGSVVVVDRAVRADSQVPLGRTKLAIMAAVLIIGLSLGSAFLLESLDPTLRRAEQVERLYGTPVIATLNNARKPQA